MLPTDIVIFVSQRVLLNQQGWTKEERLQTTDHRLQTNLG